MEAALDAARQRVGELAWEGVLLRAQLAEAEQANTKLREQAVSGGGPAAAPPPAYDAAPAPAAQ